MARPTAQAPAGDAERSPSDGASRWTGALLGLTALAVPLLFVPVAQDAFALPRLVALYVLVPLALAGPLVMLVLEPGGLRSALRWPDVAAVALGLLAVGAWLLAPDRGHDLQGEPLQYQGLLALLLYLAAYAAARFALRDTRSVRRLLGLVAVAGAVTSAYAIIQQLRLDPIWHGLDKGRVFGTLGQANALAAYLDLALPAAMALALVSRGIWRAAAAGAAILVLTALLLTYSRGGYLGAAAEVAVVLVVLGARRWRARLGGTGPVHRRPLAIGILGAAIVVLALAAIPATRGVAARAAERAISSADLQEGSIADRLDLWAVGVRISLDHPLLGTGPDSYALEFPRYRDVVLPPGRAAFLARFRPESPHDVYLAYADGLGLPALAAYLALAAGALVAVWRAVRRAVRRADGAVLVLSLAIGSALLGHLVTDAFMTAELAGSWLFWVLLGVAVGLPGLAGGRTAREAGGAGTPR